MTHTFELVRRAARFRAPLFATLLALTIGACDPADPTDPLASTDPVATDEELSTAEELPLAEGNVGRASSSGIPFGLMRQPNTAFGVLYNGAKQTMGPKYILSSLRETRARGGRVFLMLADHESFYKDGRGHFSFSKWKARIDRYKHIDITPYINDGTIVGHFMIDEPQDKTNWNGVPLTGAQMEAMAQYSKQLWPKMATIVRAPPGKIKWSGRYRYLDAAWAQVENVQGNLNINEFINQNIANARSLGLELVVGLNITKGNRNRTRMTASQIKSYGSTLLSSSYPCGFISWRYDSHVSRPDIRSAMSYLAAKARSRPRKSCGSGKVSAPLPAAPPSKGPSKEPPSSPPMGRPASINVDATGWARGRHQYVRVTWSGVKGSKVDVYRDGVRIRTTRNDGHDISTATSRTRRTYAFKVCERGSRNCSRLVRVTVG